jgi:DNA-binding transcriptional MerR regulator/methylmalonyl-CoA mutase cobalamin-binding subunit
LKKAEMLLDIGSVERETGIGKDALRVWERRYGFPVPVRDEHDERLYPQDQVDRLRLIKRLLGSGMRPSKVVGLELAELNALLAPAPDSVSQHSEEVLNLFNLIKEHQAPALRVALSRALLQQGLNDFLSMTIASLNDLVGEAWMRGEIRVFEEHLYSEQITSVLRTAIATMRDANGSPRVLLTTLPGEEHSLGLLMAEATLSLGGASCVMLGVQTPIQEIVPAVQAHRSDIVVLSFSGAATPAQVKSGLQQARQALPKDIELWSGGAGVARQQNSEEGVRLMGPLSELTEAVNAWRDARNVTVA